MCVYHMCHIHKQLMHNAVIQVMSSFEMQKQVHLGTLTLCTRCTFLELQIIIKLAHFTNHPDINKHESERWTSNWLSPLNSVLVLSLLRIFSLLLGILCFSGSSVRIYKDLQISYLPGFPLPLKTWTFSQQYTSSPGWTVICNNAIIPHDCSIPIAPTSPWWWCGCPWVFTDFFGGWGLLLWRLQKLCNLPTERPTVHLSQTFVVSTFVSLC